MSIDQDQRIVMTLDAGGTKFAFSAVQGGREIVAPIVLPSNGHDLPLCLRTIVEGFAQIHAGLAEKPVAISFAFPGPADYASGVIGDLANLPAFRGGVPLGPMLEDEFGLPVFINNDGDLFAFGEAIAGLLPEINEKLAAAGAPKRYKNLLGVTLGTGFGAGIVHDGHLFLGDNGAGAEIWDVRSKRHPRCPAEEDVSIRAVERVYAEGRELRRGRGRVTGPDLCRRLPRPRQRRSSRSPWAASPATRRPPGGPSTPWARASATPWPTPSRWWTGWS